jgi:osmotically-inducible protein OsmY
MESDLKLRKRVIQELEWEPAIDATRLTVDVHDGVVTLTGTTRSLAEKLAAENAVKRLKGVRAVVEGLAVQPADASQRGDAAIAQAAADALERDVRVPRDRVTVTVENGVVTLEGELEWPYDRELVGRVMSRLTGVTRVDNQLRAAPRVESPDLRTEIVAALARSARLAAADIRVEVNGRTVILLGNVDSWAELEEAERIAWAAPDVDTVENDIAVRLPLQSTA